MIQLKNNVKIVTLLRKQKSAKKVNPTLVKSKSCKIDKIIISPELYHKARLASSPSKLISNEEQALFNPWHNTGERGAIKEGGKKSAKILTNSQSVCRLAYQFGRAKGRPTHEMYIITLKIISTASVMCFQKR